MLAAPKPQPILGVSFNYGKGPDIGIYARVQKPVVTPERELSAGKAFTDRHIGEARALERHTLCIYTKGMLSPMGLPIRFNSV
jgi:hypothetical protein